MITLEQGDYKNLSSYFVLYFYLRESRGKAFCFHQAKTIFQCLVNQRHPLLTSLLQSPLDKYKQT